MEAAGNDLIWDRWSLKVELTGFADGLEIGSEGWGDKSFWSGCMEE